MDNKSALAHTLPIVAMICFILAFVATNDKMFLWLALLAIVVFIGVLISCPFVEYIEKKHDMERYNHQSDMDKLIEAKSKKSTDSLKKELERIEAKASQLRDKEFDGFKMNPKVSRKLDAYAQERVAIEVVLNDRGV